MNAFIPLVADHDAGRGVIWALAVKANKAVVNAATEIPSFVFIVLLFFMIPSGDATCVVRADAGEELSIVAMLEFNPAH